MTDSLFGSKEALETNKRVKIIVVRGNFEKLVQCRKINSKISITI